MLSHLGRMDWQGLFLDFVASSSLVALAEKGSNKYDKIRFQLKNELDI